MKDLLSLQVARALAVLLVVVYHAHGVLEKRAAALGLAEVRFWAEETNVVKFGATGVDIFFVISGFIIYHTTPHHTTPHHGATARFGLGIHAVPRDPGVSLVVGGLVDDGCDGLVAGYLC